MGKRIITLILILWASTAWGMLPGFYTVNAGGDYPNPYILSPVATTVNNWSVNTGTSTDAVLSNDGDTSYCYTSAGATFLTFEYPDITIPSGATVDYVKLIFVARSVGTASDPDWLGPRVYIGGAWQWTWDGFAPTIGAEYSTVSYTATTNPVTGVAWTVADINSLSWGLSSYASTDVEHRVTYARLEIGWTP